jgi:hypothetical protein
MKFEEILPALREGIKVRRKSWNKRNYIVVAKDNLIVDENDYAIPFCIDDFSADDWEIVKRVKLRDLTEEQFKKWHERNCEGNKCKDCVFNQNKVNCIYVAYCWIKDKSVFSNKFLDQEIEIQEE